MPMGESSVEEVCNIMSESPKWSECYPLMQTAVRVTFIRRINNHVITKRNE